jgi:CheY-like chemotaxis protein
MGKITKYRSTITNVFQRRQFLLLIPMLIHKAQRMFTVLLIDDNASILRDMAELLRYEGYAVLETADGEQGLALALQHRPDLVISDLRRPGLDGFGLLEALKVHPSTASIPVLFVSATGDKRLIEEGLRRGAAQFLQKPFRLESLFGAVADCLKSTP